MTTYRLVSHSGHFSEYGIGIGQIVFAVVEIEHRVLKSVVLTQTVHIIKNEYMIIVVVKRIDKKTMEEVKEEVGGGEGGGWRS